MSVKWYWCSEVEGERDPVSLFVRREDAEENGADARICLRRLLDDSGAAYDPSWTNGSSRADALIQRCLLPLLYEATEPEEVARLMEGSGLALYAQGPYHGAEFIPEWPRDCIPVLPELGVREIIAHLQGGFRDIRRVLIWLTEFERLKQQTLGVVGPERLRYEEGLEVVTSGSQAGVPPTVRAYALYWHRFLDWQAAIGEREGGTCAVDLCYILQLERTVSWPGFLTALSESSKAGR